MTHALIQNILHWNSFLALGYSSPNPPVAALAVELGKPPEKGGILADAYTQKTGKNHAERELYEFLRRKYFHIPKHELYVTLEPCTHYGRTPPCSDLIFEFKPERLILGNRDPNPLVKRSSDEVLQKYREQGVQVEFSKELKDLSYPFLCGFFQRVQKKRPKIILKSVVTREGFFSPTHKKRTQIHSTESQPFLQLLRAKVDAILVGVGTIIQDTPGLNFSGVPTTREFSRENPWEREHSFGFWESIHFYSKFQPTWNHHHEKIQDYQPKRIFILPPHPHASLDSFFQKQMDIQHQYKNSESIFFILGNPKDVDKNLAIHLENFPHKYYLPNLETAEPILEILATVGINLLVVEGGNSMYSLFYPILDEEDEILILQNHFVSWEKGIRPVFWDDLKERKCEIPINPNEIVKIYQKVK